MDYIFEKLIETLHADKERMHSAVKAQADFWHGKPSSVPFLLKCYPETEEYRNIPSFNYEEIHYDSEKMLCSQLAAAVASCYGGEQSVPSVRANMGCGIFASIFGMKQTVFKDKMPWLLEDLDKDTIKNMTAADLSLNGEFKIALEHMQYMRETLNGACYIYPPDVQGAFDLAHIIFGDNIFYEIYDDPKFVHHLLDLCCEAIFLGMDAVFEVIPESNNTVCHYSAVAMPRDMGGIKLSEDTSTLLAPEHIDEFVTPYIRKIFNHYGGGYVHYCGFNEHLFNSILTIENAFGINFGNPEKHDMYDILRQLAAHDTVYYGGINIKYGNLKEYYTSLYEAARTKSGRNILLLSQGCSEKELEEIRSAFKLCEIN